ncbi:N-6 DNA methylase [Aliivibrio fischeri]|uniref:N-6 DNA methylase n=1 Tax=Aliivibrio fischeri TaxID=668 RepID=UPI0007C4E969|nr:N-6 DNA methylase [Aliivibrio fischeri]TDM54636.1 restriction endonuclease subunit M [Aliivibrio fischeri]
MSTSINETETVIKKIIPYLSRRGYEASKDFDYEVKVNIKDESRIGFIDILVKYKKKPAFLIEAKRLNKTLTQKDRKQVLDYANSLTERVGFVVLTNGTEIQCINVATQKNIMWDGIATNLIPTKNQLDKVLPLLKKDPMECRIFLKGDKGIPFKPGLPLRQINRLFYKCHSTIRKIEKNEENAFADFSKLLFLKLLEEKYESEENFELKYTYRFHELAEKSNEEADQVKDAVLRMIERIVAETPYGEVLKDPIKLKNPKTFQSIVRDLSKVSFQDCSLDSKGAAFEYFVRATLKGKKLGQYFTPRELVQAMLYLVGREKITNKVLFDGQMKVLDPSCGTGGFLVFLMQDAISRIKQDVVKRKITNEQAEKAIKKLKENVFFGSDANEGVACSAKMNMIIAGDGHTNIQHEDSLSAKAKNWDVLNPNCDLILTNPPFGTSEKASLTGEDSSQYPIKTVKGQLLFLQKMVRSTKAGGEICTVIDDGVLNNDNASSLREWLLQQCKIISVVKLPDDTFRPNKINVRSSLLYMEKRKEPDLNLEEEYDITFCEFLSLGYTGAGDKIRSFDLNSFLQDIEEKVLNTELGSKRKGDFWHAFDAPSIKVSTDKTFRLDYKYWDVSVIDEISSLKDKGMKSIEDINLISTLRGKSPSADHYVDESEGYALVVKAGSNVSKFGELIYNQTSDWIEKDIYQEFVDSDRGALEKYDILLSSTGDGTLGKACVFDAKFPAIADGHVTIIRIDRTQLDPYYVADYLRAGFGKVQIERLYTGSTGLIELTPEQVKSIIIDDVGGIDNQKVLSKELRKKEKSYMNKIDKADQELIVARGNFFHA